MFTGVKVFSATKAKERDDLGEQVTRWLRANADLEIVDRTVMQSSDNEFHCLTVVIFSSRRPKPERLSGARLLRPALSAASSRRR